MDTKSPTDNTVMNVDIVHIVRCAETAKVNIEYHYAISLSPVQHLLLPPWIRSFVVFRHRRVTIFSWGVFRQSGVVYSFEMGDPALFVQYLDLTSFIPEIFGSFLMTSLFILSSLVYPFPLFLKYYNKLLLQYDNKFIKICSPSLRRMCLLNCVQVKLLRRIAGYCNLNKYSVVPTCLWHVQISRTD
jgi:hypothetical protein